MMGDSAAMFVDALTYLFNLLAERRKSRFDEIWRGTDETDPVRVARIKAREKRKMTLHLELVPPLISVTTLLVVTAYILHDSISELLLDVQRDESEQSDPDLNLMMIFSALNLLLDIMNVCCFARAKKLCGYTTVSKSGLTGDSNTKHRASGAGGASEFQQSSNYHQVLMQDDDDDVEALDNMEGYSWKDRMNAMKDDKEADAGSNGNRNAPDVDAREGGPTNNGTSGLNTDTMFEIGFDDDDDDDDDEGTSNQKNVESGKYSGVTEFDDFDDEGDNSDDEQDEAVRPEDEANLNMCSAYTVSEPNSILGDSCWPFLLFRYFHERTNEPTNSHTFLLMTNNNKLLPYRPHRHHISTARLCRHSP